MTLWLLPLLLTAARGDPGRASQALETFVGGDRSGAYPMLVEASEEDGGDVPMEVWLFRGAVERERGDLSLAAATFRAGSVAHPDARALWMELATTESWQQRWPSALDAFDEALAIAPNDPAAAAGRARTLWWSGRRDAGLRAVNQVLLDHPEDAEALALRDDIRADRPRTITLLGGGRQGDGGALLGGGRASWRSGSWTLQGEVQRATGVGNDAEANAMWTTGAGVAWRLAPRAVVEVGHRSWLGEASTHAMSMRVTSPLGWVQPHAGALVGQLAPVLEAGLRVGRDGPWVSATGYRSFPGGSDAAPSTTGALALGTRMGRLGVRVDGSYADLAPGPLLQGGAQLSLRLDDAWSVGLQGTRTEGWLSRTDLVASCTVSF